MAKKKPTAQWNTAGGIDLIVERDAGNEILILTGKKSNSLKFWKQLQTLSENNVHRLENYSS